jgi:Right handed beta helix region
VVTLGQRQPGAAPGACLVEFFDRTGETMNTKRALIAVALCGGLMAVLAATAAAQQPQCGDVITEDTTLQEDLSCGGVALTIGADDLTLDLGGHTVSAGLTGIENPGHQRVTIRNGSVFGDPGVRLVGVAHNRVLALTASGLGSGLVLSSSDANLLRGVVARGDEFAGLRLDGANGNRIVDSQCGSNSLAALFIEAHGNQVVRTTISGNEGLILSGDENRIADSSVTGELFGGAEVTGSGNVLARTAIGAGGLFGAALRLSGDDNVVRDGTLEDSGPGEPTVELSGGAGNVLRGNEVTRGQTDAQDGMFVAAEATDTTLAENFVSGFTDDGIDVESPTTVLRFNVANDNGDLGIEAVPGVRGQGNLASGNGNPLQCLNILCT